MKALAALTKKDEATLLAAAEAADAQEAGKGGQGGRGSGNLTPLGWKTKIRPKLGPLDQPVGQHALADEIAADIVHNSALRFQSLYSQPRSAGWLVSYESSEGEQKKSYEASAWADPTLGIREPLIAAARAQRATAGPAVGVVGLAVGEGQGEIELLRQILADESSGLQVHYLAVDLSAVLNVGHISNVRQAFAREIEDGRLITSAVTGDIFRLNEALKRGREDVASRYSLNRPENFLPEGIGIFATYLGNCIGNQQIDPVDQIFTSLKEAFANRPLVLLLGISIIRSASEVEQYSPSTWEFFLQAPYHILYNLKLLRAADPDEFRLPCKLPALTEENKAKVEKFLKERCISDFPPVGNKPNFPHKNGFKVARYQFHYKPAGTITLAGNALAWRSAGDTIILATIDKFDVASVKEVLARKGYRVETMNPKTVTPGEPEYERTYELLAVHFPNEPDRVL